MGGRWAGRGLSILVACWTLGCPAPGLAAERKALANGLCVIAAANPNTDVMTAEMLLPISVADEPEEQQGIRYLTQRMLLRGIRGKSGDAMGEELSAVGGVVGVNVGLDYVETYVQAPSEGFEVALELLAEAMRWPAFPPEEIEREKRAAIAAMRAATEDPFQKTYQAFREELYGAGPYGRWVLGSPRTVEALTREELLCFYRDHYGPDMAVLTVAGGVEVGRAVRMAQKVFGDWQGEARQDQTPKQEVGPLTRSDVIARELPTSRAHLLLGFPAPAVGEAHYYAMQVIDSLLCGGSTAWLPRVLRDEVGLVYQVSSFYPTLKGPSHFGIYAVTETASVGEVKATVLRQLERLRGDLAPAAELARAKRYLLGSYALSRQRSQAQAYAAAWYEILGLRPDFDQEYRERINSVTPEEVREAARALVQYFVLALTMPSG